MNLIEGCYVLLVLMVFVNTLAVGVGVYGWWRGPLLAISAVGVLILLPVLIHRLPRRKRPG